MEFKTAVTLEPNSNDPITQERIILTFLLKELQDMVARNPVEAISELKDIHNEINRTLIMMKAVKRKGGKETEHYNVGSLYFKIARMCLSIGYRGVLSLAVRYIMVLTGIELKHIKLKTKDEIISLLEGYKVIAFQSETERLSHLEEIVIHLSVVDNNGELTFNLARDLFSYMEENSDNLRVLKAFIINEAKLSIETRIDSNANNLITGEDTDDNTRRN